MLTKRSLAIPLVVLSTNAFAYNVEIHNNSEFLIQVKNPSSTYNVSILPSQNAILPLVDGNSYQIQYKGGLFPTDNLGTISRIQDGDSSGEITATFQQPADSSITWILKDFEIGGHYYGDATFKNYPEAISIQGCQNLGWGSVCKNQGDELKLTFEANGGVEPKSKEFKVFRSKSVNLNNGDCGEGYFLSSKEDAEEFRDENSRKLNKILSKWGIALLQEPYTIDGYYYGNHIINRDSPAPKFYSDFSWGVKDFGDALCVKYI
ncbi:hypothetical protein AKJ18_22255 [Vibrio xuii]|nr:hypothetical protein AKJ18_22255 [Vibrio xuii]